MLPVILGALAGYLLGRNTDGERRPKREAPREPAPERQAAPARVEGRPRRPTPAQRAVLLEASHLDRYPDGAAGWLQGGRIMERAVSTARALMNAELLQACLEKRDQLEAEWREAGDVTTEGAAVEGQGAPTTDEDKARVAAQRLQAYLDAAKVRGRVTVESTSDGLVLLATLEAPTEDDLKVVARVPEVDGVEVRVVLPAPAKGNGKAAAVEPEQALATIPPVRRDPAVKHTDDDAAAIAAARALTAIEGLEQIGLMQRGILAALQAGDEGTATELRALEAKLMAESHAASGEEAS